jgi:hypothetical protein
VTAQEKFDDLVRDGVWPFLRAHGFKRTKATFHRPVGDNWEVINLQKSEWSDRRSVEFTVNLAVGIDRLREQQFDWGPGKRPSYTRCQLWERLGIVLTERDVWWKIGRLTDLSALADTINTAVERYALPWLEARSSDEALLALLRSERGLAAQPIHHLHWFGKLAGQLGDAALARRVVAEQERRKPYSREVRPDDTG